MIKKLTCLACALIGVTTLSGCAYTNPEGQMKLETQDFQPELSRASNLLQYFRYYNVNANPLDQEVEGDPKIAKDGSVVLEGLGWAAGLHNVGTMSGPLPGISNGWGAIGIGLGLSITKSLFTRANPLTHTALLGYLPLEEAADFTEARAVFNDKIAQAAIETFKELYPDAKINVNKSEDRVSLVYDNYVEIEDEKLGCKFWNEEVDKTGDYCAVRVRAFKRHMSEHFVITANPVISNEGNKVWVFTSDMGWIGFAGGKKQGINWTNFMFALSKHLPKYAYIFMPTLDNPNGKNPMFVIEKDRVNFFIKPKVDTQATNATK